MYELTSVVAFARKTGDIAVLSATDLSVIALTYQWEIAENGEKNIRTDPSQKKPVGETATAGEASPEQTGEKEGEVEEEEEDSGEEVEEEGHSEEEVELAIDEVTRSIDQVLLEDPTTSGETAEASEVTTQSTELAVSNASTPAARPVADAPLNDDEESDGGEWITPSNVNQHRSHDLGLLPVEGNTKDTGPIAAACMTGDFAVQNVLLGMGMGLVGEGGKRISKVKSFVLRCHACFK